jgi:hypothetical protein
VSIELVKDAESSSFYHASRGAVNPFVDFREFRFTIVRNLCSKRAEKRDGSQTFISGRVDRAVRGWPLEHPPRGMDTDEQVSVNQTFSLLERKVKFRVVS